MKTRSFVALMLCALTASAAELPVRTVVLYKHGVGYFERNGTLGPGESAKLDFKAEEMNDVLKSLTVNEQGGKVTGLRYDSSIPLSQKLTEFPFEVGNGSPLSAVIDQFKGARIEMAFGTQMVAGSVVSARVIAGDKDRAEREQLTMLLDSGELRNVDLAAATAIRFSDAKLQLQFKDYLAALTLVSGKPISFISQLYAPKFITRLGAELAENTAVAPTVYTGAVANKAVAPPPAPLARRMGGVAGGALSGILGGQPGAGYAEAQSSSVGSIASSTNATEIADLFQYSIAAPVTVKKDESAMMPFLQQKISARKLIIYSDASKPNPFSAAELTNNSGKTLDGGPITVYDAGAYAGEALVETIKNADKRFISYGVDLGTRIATNQDSRNDGVRELHAHNGLLTSKSAVVQKKTYTVHNVDARPKTLIIEHPVRVGFNLINTAKPLETARDVYRFEVKVPANGSLDFPVTEENVYDSQTSVSSLNPDGLLVYIRNKNISDAARKQLQQIADIKTQIANADAEKRSVTDEINNVTRDEERNRQNISSLSAVSGQQQLVQDYARKLSEQETQIAKLRDRVSALDQQRVTLQTQLNGLIEKLDF